MSRIAVKAVGEPDDEAPVPVGDGDITDVMVMLDDMQQNLLALRDQVRTMSRGEQKEGALQTLLIAVASGNKAILDQLRAPAVPRKPQAWDFDIQRDGFGFIERVLAKELL